MSGPGNRAPNSTAKGGANPNPNVNIELGSDYQEQLKRLADDAEEHLDYFPCDHDTFDECCSACQLNYEIARSRELLNRGE